MGVAVHDLPRGRWIALWAAQTKECAVGSYMRNDKGALDEMVNEEELGDLQVVVEEEGVLAVQIIPS